MVKISLLVRIGITFLCRFILCIFVLLGYPFYFFNKYHILNSRWTNCVNRAIFLYARIRDRTEFHILGDGLLRIRRVVYAYQFLCGLCLETFSMSSSTNFVSSIHSLLLVVQLGLPLFGLGDTSMYNNDRYVNRRSCSCHR